MPAFTFAPLLLSWLLAPAGDFCGQPVPGRTPALFAPGVVNAGLATRDFTAAPDGGEFYFRVGLPGFTRTTIVGSRRVEGRWTPPEVPAFAADPRWRTLEPCISPDGKRFYFTSDRPADPGATKPGPMGLWVMERNGAAWSQARRLGVAVNGPDGTFYPSVTQDGTLYFARDGADGLGSVWRLRPGSTVPERLPDAVQCGQARYNPFVAPDESFLILSVVGLKEAVGGLDYYILFRTSDDRWSLPLNLGPDVNGPGNGDIAASLSPDGRFLLFASDRVRPDALKPGEQLTYARLRALALEPGANGDSAIYWVEAGFLYDLRRRAEWPRPKP